MPPPALRCQLPAAVSASAPPGARGAAETGRCGQPPPTPGLTGCPPGPSAGDLARAGAPAPGTPAPWPRGRQPRGPRTGAPPARPGGRAGPRAPWPLPPLSTRPGVWPAVPCRARALTRGSGGEAGARRPRRCVCLPWDGAEGAGRAAGSLVGALSPHPGVLRPGGTWRVARQIPDRHRVPRTHRLPVPASRYRA